MAEFDPKAYLADVGAGSDQGAAPPVDAIQVAQFNPKAYLNSIGEQNEAALQAEYGTLPQQALAGAEALASGASLGASRHLENATGLTTPEAQAKRAEANPITSGAGSFLGAGALLYGTGGVGALAEGAGLVTRAGAAALEGGALGAGQLINDTALGDPSLNAQKVASYVGMGALLGGGLTLGGAALAKAVPYGANRLGALANAVKKVVGGAEKKAESAIDKTAEAIALPAEAEIVDAPLLPGGVKPTTIEEMEKKVADAKFAGDALPLGQKEALLDANSRVANDLTHGVNQMQVESLANQRARDAYNTAKEMGDTGQALQAYEGLQKKELNAHVDNTIRSVGGDLAPTSDAVQGGNQASKYFTEQYQAEKKAAGELVGQAKALNTQGVDHLSGVTQAMSKAVPQIGKMLEISGGEVKVLPYKTSMGMSKQTYGAVKDAISSLQENPQSFSDLFAIRKGLENGVNIFTSDAATRSEIMGLKASMMEYMQNQANNTTFRDAFKRYAVNESERQVIENVFGASVGSPEFGAISKIKPEVIGDRIFANTANVNAAKAILPKEQFNHILSNWLSEARAAATDNNIFSSNKFNSFLKKNQDALNVAFAENPSALQKLKDFITISRILPDAPSVNPSGTAKTLIEYLKESKSATEGGINLLHYLKEKTMGKIEHQVAMQNLNNQLQGKAARVSMLEEAQRIIIKQTESITNKAKAIFSGNSGNAIKGAAIPTMVDHYENHADKVRSLSSDPAKTLDHLSETTQNINEAMPNITQGLNATMIAGIKFLSSKLPAPNQELPFSTPWVPTNAQKERFNRYFTVVNDPLVALNQVKTGSLSNETMEALQAVHPDLLEEMKQKVMEQINPKKKDLNYATQIALSKFLGHPMSNSMLPQVIASNQASFLLPSPHQQSMGSKRGSASGMKHLNLANRVSSATNKEMEES